MPQNLLAGKAQSESFEAFAATLHILSKILIYPLMNGSMPIQTTESWSVNSPLLTCDGEIPLIVVSNNVNSRQSLHHCNYMVQYTREGIFLLLFQRTQVLIRWEWTYVGFLGVGFYYMFLTRNWLLNHMSLKEWGIYNTALSPAMHKLIFNIHTYAQN